MRHTLALLMCLCMYYFNVGFRVLLFTVQVGTVTPTASYAVSDDISGSGSASMTSIALVSRL